MDEQDDAKRDSEELSQIISLMKETDSFVTYAMKCVFLSFPFLTKTNLILVSIEEI